MNKSDSFLLHEEAPFNGEPRLERVGEALLTPTPHFFVRNHAPIPDVDPDEHRLRVDGPGNRAAEWSLDDLRTRFDEATAVITLQCAGNRRRELMDHREIPGEVPWRCGAVGTAEWRGVRLRDVLLESGVPAVRPGGGSGGVAHVELLGVDRVDKPGGTIPFGGSIPLEKALDPSVLLAWEMNGEPLRPEHGSPLRAVVPGYIGARSVKWLGTIRVRDTPSDNYYQARSYRLFPPEATAGTADWESATSLGELTLNSVITSPPEGVRLPVEAGRESGVEVRGYALAGGDRRVARVEVSADGGRSWARAELEGPGGTVKPGAWCLWRARVDVPVRGECEGADSADRTDSADSGQIELVARAWDSEGDGQPAEIAPLWNFKGYMNNAWHRVRVRLG